MAISYVCLPLLMKMDSPRKKRVRVREKSKGKWKYEPREKKTNEVNREITISFSFDVNLK